jgi:hypothetical protein
MNFNPPWSAVNTRINYSKLLLFCSRVGTAQPPHSPKFIQKPRPRPAALALALQNLKPGQSCSQAVTLAWPMAWSRAMHITNSIRTSSGLHWSLAGFFGNTQLLPPWEGPDWVQVDCIALDCTHTEISPPIIFHPQFLKYLYISQKNLPLYHLPCYCTLPYFTNNAKGLPGACSPTGCLWANPHFKSSGIYHGCKGWLESYICFPWFTLNIMGVLYNFNQFISHVSQGYLTKRNLVFVTSHKAWRKGSLSQGS